MKNEGMSQYRFRSNPLEEIFTIAWEELNTSDFGHDTTLDYMLAKDPNRPCAEVTDRDRMVAATVVQWLGSPVGQNFLRDVRETYEEGLDEEWMNERTNFPE